MRMNLVVPMAGRGTRFLQAADRNPEYRKPKPLINVAGHPIIEWSVKCLPQFEQMNKIFLVLQEHVEAAQIDAVLHKLFPENTRVVVVETVTEGPACTALLAKSYVNDDQPLMICDSDQYIDGKTHLAFIAQNQDVDGVIPVFSANDPKWSYSRVDAAGKVVEVAEKKVISANANIGAYFFRKGSGFVSAAEEMIRQNDRAPNNEFYVAPVYNYLVRKGKSVKLSRPKFVYGLGTPEDVEEFVRVLARKGVPAPFRNDRN